MPKTIISYRFPVNPGAGPASGQSYTTDNGEVLNVTGRFVLPPDLDLSSAQSIVTAIGAEIITENTICSDNVLGKLRKLIFYRASGNTMSVSFSSKDDALTVATAVKGVLDAGNSEVVCIKLEGEEFRNLNDRMQLNYTGTTAISHKAPSSADKQNYLTGGINYTSDVTGPELRLIRSITESSDNVPAAQIISAFTACAGTVQDSVGCGNGRRNPMKHRRFIVDFVTKLDPTDAAENSQTESIEVPTASSSEADILNCGRAIAALPGAYCIGYKGESHSRIHRLI